MSNQTWVETLVSQVSAGTVVQSTTTSPGTSLLNPQMRVTFPAGYFYVGRSLRITVLGSISNSVAVQTMTFNHTMGPASSVVGFTTGAVNLSSGAAQSSVPFVLQTWVTARGVSSQTTLMGQSIISGGPILSQTGVGPSSQDTGQAMGPNTSPATTASFDATLGSQLDLMVVTSISTTGLLVSVQQYFVEALN